MADPQASGLPSPARRRGYRLSGILREYEIHHNQHRPHRPHRSLHAAAPLRPLPEPVDLDRYRVQRQAHTACLINEYRLVA